MMNGNGTKNEWSGQSSIRCSRRPAGGFTLIEVLTAVALTAGLMLGVIQIFKMSTDAASQTEQASDAFEMGRGVMAQLESDLSMFAPEGYLWVRCQEMDPSSWAKTVGLSSISITDSTKMNETGRYRFDGLSFSVVMAAPTAAQLVTSSGTMKYNPVLVPASNTQNLCNAGGQVAYTFGQRVSAVPSYNGQASPYMGTLINSNQRGVVLVRKLYLDQSLVPNGTGYQILLGQGQTGTAAQSITGSIGNTYALTQNTTLAQAATEYLTNSNPTNWVLTPLRRLSPASFYYALNPLVAGSSPTWQPIINVPDPSTYNAQTNQANIGNLSELDNIVCDRVSEFFVEVWNGQEWVPHGANLPASGGGGNAYTFTSANMPGPNYIAINSTGSITTTAGGSWVNAGAASYSTTATGYASRWRATASSTNLALCPDGATTATQVTLLRDNMLWLGTAANPLNRYDMTGGALPGGTAYAANDLPPTTMPSMVRVTLVVHPHSDTSPLINESYYAGSGPYRYQGVVFREVFKLSGTIH